MTVDDKTLDPLSMAGPDLVDAPGRPAPSLRILFHSDLSRVGAETPALSPGGDEITLGRSAPLFEDAEGYTAPLDDPCISRSQLSLRWDPGDQVFVVRQEPRGRRAVRLWSPVGAPLDPDLPAPPGSMLALGDWVLLLLVNGQPRRGVDRMGMVGEGAAAWRLRRAIGEAAGGDSLVLVHGESGAGKELVARAIHAASPRRDHDLLVVNCAALPDSLVEAELFGHEKGAFTGASADRPGFFRAAGRGTLFLDEVGELPLALQGKLLRALQERRVMPVGASREEPFEARVVAATNRQLDQEVAAGRFRHDLYYRLAALELEVPPLRARPEDTPLLMAHFLGQRARQTPALRWLVRPADQRPPPMPLELMLRLMAHPWPGNVRQLQNSVERLAAANAAPGQRSFVEPEGLLQDPAPSPVAAAPPTAPVAAPAPDQPRPDADSLLALLDQHDHVQRRVARLLGVSHTTLNRWMRELGLRRPLDIPEEEIRAVQKETGGDLVAMARQLRVSTRGLKLRITALDRA